LSYVPGVETTNFFYEVLALEDTRALAGT